jgi:hypothetical protein
LWRRSARQNIVCGDTDVAERAGGSRTTATGLFADNQIGAFGAHRLGD